MALSDNEQELFKQIVDGFATNPDLEDIPPVERHHSGGDQDLSSPPQWPWSSPRLAPRLGNIAARRHIPEHRYSRNKRMIAAILAGCAAATLMVPVARTVWSRSKRAAVSATTSPVTSGDLLQARRLGLRNLAALTATGTCEAELAVMRDKLEHSTPTVTATAYPSVQAYNEAIATLHFSQQTVQCVPPASAEGIYAQQLPNGRVVRLTSSSFILPVFNAPNVCPGAPLHNQLQAEMNSYAPGTPEYADFGRLLAVAPSVC